MLRMPELPLRKQLKCYSPMSTWMASYDSICHVQRIAPQFLAFLKNSGIRKISGLTSMDPRQLQRIAATIRTIITINQPQQPQATQIQQRQLPGGRQQLQITSGRENAKTSPENYQNRSRTLAIIVIRTDRSTTTSGISSDRSFVFTSTLCRKIKKISFLIKLMSKPSTKLTKMPTIRIPTGQEINLNKSSILIGARIPRRALMIPLKAISS